MARRNSLAEWIIDLASSNPPRDREEWARAMRSEFDALEGARVGWALGCLGTAMSWRLKADWGFLLLFAATCALSSHLTLYPFFWAARWRVIPHDWIGPAFRLYRFLAPTSLSLALAVLRPGYWLLAGLALPLAFVASGVIECVLAFHSSVWDVRPFNAMLEVGTAALIGYCLIGAMVGRKLGLARLAE
jgi:hypothetical protein